MNNGTTENTINKTASVLWDCSSWVGAASYTPLGGKGLVLKAINTENGLPEFPYLLPTIYRQLFIVVDLVFHLDDVAAVGIVPAVMVRDDVVSTPAF